MDCAFLSSVYASCPSLALSGVRPFCHGGVIPTFLLYRGGGLLDRSAFLRFMIFKPLASWLWLLVTLHSATTNGWEATSLFWIKVSLLSLWAPILTSDTCWVSITVSALQTLKRRFCCCSRLHHLHRSLLVYL